MIGLLFFFQWSLSFIFETLARLTNSANNASSLFAESITPTPLLITFLSTVILSPLVEEIIFRGLLLEKVFPKNRVGMLASSVLFGLAHLPSNLFSALAYITPGLVFAYYYLKRKQLSELIVVHCINNFLAFLLVTFF